MLTSSCQPEPHVIGTWRLLAKVEENLTWFV
jgi:hypothetical protein